MKKMVFIILSAFYIHLSFGQTLIGVVDMDKLIELHPEKPYYDSISKAYEVKATDSLMKINNKIMRIAYDKEHSCSYYRVMQQRDSSYIDSLLIQKESQINLLKEKLQKLQKIFIGEFEAIREKHHSYLKESIIAVIKEYALKRGFLYIINKPSTAFFNYENDLTIVINKILNQKIKGQ